MGVAVQVFTELRGQLRTLVIRQEGDLHGVEDIGLDIVEGETEVLIVVRSERW